MATLVVLGCGFTGTALARRRLAAGWEVRATVRRPEERARLRAMGVEAHAHPALDAAAVAGLVRGGEDVAVCFPPDGATDLAVAPACGRARAVAYVSTTGVYGGRRGRVDESTPVDPAGERSRARLVAEEAWRAAGATVLRAAGIYGPGRGLHRRLLAGAWRAPEGEAKVVSRVHVDDLAAIVDACLARALGAETFVVADDAPVPQVEVVRWLCATMGLPTPTSAPLAEVPETLRHDRSVSNDRVKSATGVRLAYPSYREGFAQCLAVERG